ncbi:MAG: hypothetical protein ACHREM_05650 [Polyangiales bacterium]
MPAFVLAACGARTSLVLEAGDAATESADPDSATSIDVGVDSRRSPDVVTTSETDTTPDQLTVDAPHDVATDEGALGDGSMRADSDTAEPDAALETAALDAARPDVLDAADVDTALDATSDGGSTVEVRVVQLAPHLGNLDICAVAVGTSTPDPFSAATPLLGPLGGALSATEPSASAYFAFAPGLLTVRLVPAHAGSCSSEAVPGATFTTPMLSSARHYTLAFLALNTASPTGSVSLTTLTDEDTWSSPREDDSLVRTFNASSTYSPANIDLLNSDNSLMLSAWIALPYDSTIASATPLPQDSLSFVEFPAGLASRVGRVRLSTIGTSSATVFALHLVSARRYSLFLSDQSATAAGVWCDDTDPVYAPASSYSVCAPLTPPP